jgi:hypothetical protein
MGTRPSYTMVEKYLTKYNTKFTRYDDSDLNALHYHRYDWPITNQGHWEHGMRRFWIVEK